jgi:hypothetical protein
MIFLQLLVIVLEDLFIGVHDLLGLPLVLDVLLNAFQFSSLQPDLLLYLKLTTSLLYEQ